MTKKRNKALGLAATLAAVPLFLSNAAGANPGPGYTDSSDNPSSYPPMVECAKGPLGWWQWASYENKNVQVLSTSNPFIVTGITLPPGHITVTEAVTWDERTVENPQLTGDIDGDQLEATVDEATTAGQGQGQGQQPDPELYEKMFVKFIKDGKVVAVTPFHTPDLPDDNPYAWSRSMLGTVDLPNGADTVVLTHADAVMKTDGRDNAFIPKALCIEVTPFEVEEPPTTTTPPTTVPPTTVTPQTTPPVTEPPVEVLDEVVTAPELAFTGDESVRNLGIGAALVAIGAGLLGATRRRHQAETA